MKKKAGRPAILGDTQIMRVYITDDMADKVKKEAMESGKTMSQLIRDIISVYYNNTK